ncbi:MAG: ParB/RepB/Spo0J family partition protein [Gemmatimonadaceae bacterium]|nr:ParB/RepB/Spo0J family partition protein [Gemmatimonadaceae bacterium]MCW5826992.1 ParB/RepB/Spo0J family partition protein [Gemmatimonadaceae bacterium]
MWQASQNQLAANSSYTKYLDNNSLSQELMTTDKGRRLGRGLEALIARAPTRAPGESDATRAPSSATAATASAVGSPYQLLPMTKIRPNPLQPRKEFREQDLADLEASLRVSGLLQPITVRPAPTGSGYELIAGERRFRAAQRLNWKEIPAVVRDVDDRLLLSLAMVENLQRADLNPIEEAEGYEQLIRDFSLTQQEVADIVGKDRSTVANTLRLLALPASVRRLVWDGALSVGHARALLGLGDATRMADLARTAVADGLSVRDVEQLVRAAVPGKPGKKSAAPADSRSAEVRHIEDRLRRRLGTDVRIVQAGKKSKGELRIAFYNDEDFERLMELILGPESNE